MIVVVALLLSVSTCVTAAVAAMSGDRRSTWVGMALFVVMIVPVMVVRFAAAPDVRKGTPSPLMIRTAQ